MTRKEKIAKAYEEYISIHDAANEEYISIRETAYAEFERILETAEND